MFKLRQSLVDQVVAYMSRAIIFACRVVFMGRARTRKPERVGCHFYFRQHAVFRKLLHYVTVAVASGKIHFDVSTVGILTQGLLDSAHRLDKFAPVHGSQETEAADAVAHRHLVGRLLLVLRLHQVLYRHAELGEVLLDPGERHSQGRALSLKPAGKFRDKRTRQRRV